MKFSLLSLVALLTVTASALTPFQPAPGGFEVRMKRQQNKPAVQVGAMTDADGNVVPYNREGAKRARRVKARRAIEAEMHK
ncbi:hypothetical protein GMORB2_1319 [Geosmithia morbida]|uniref:Uncharacterized protein n=1 Tax=Geosmithia morbida TaxID=1094350 RepID=A0A9P4Z2K5_9HYPO|nr:uncharacterized protein GMORB2_1319 [Geosmithia morbida]KAF4126073.1 hypothetical protein GMORB2_1319 [Geosmithia morbida]